MKTIAETKTFNVYEFDELSKQAKEKVREDEMENREPFILTDIYNSDLRFMFGNNNDLQVQYSLGYCQGDGLNIYGELYPCEIFDCLDNNRDGHKLDEYRNMLTEEEKALLNEYYEHVDAIKLEYNNRYCYSLASYINIVDECEYVLNDIYDYIDTELLEKFEKMVRDIFGDLCDIYEQYGYEYFYEFTDDELRECSLNKLFLEDGTFYDYM